MTLLIRRFLDAFERHPESAALDDVWSMFKVPGFECSDLSPSLAQAAACFAEAKAIWHESSEKRVAEIRARKAGITSRVPWSAVKTLTPQGHDEGEWYYVELPGVDKSGLAAYNNVGVWTDRGVTSKGNAEFIASAPDDIDWLLAEREELKRRLAEAEKK